MNVESIRQMVVDGHLMPQSEIDAMAAQWQSAGGSPDDAEAFVTHLISQQEITEFQGLALLAGISGPYQLGPYEVYDRIAAGRLGSIFRATQREFNQAVGLKIFPTNVNQDPETAVRMAREMRVAVQVDHPNVVRTYQVGRSGGVVFLAIEDLQGGTLENLLQRQAQNITPELPQMQACALIHEVALGLQHLHEQGIVLRDIQPAHIWVTADNHAKLLEFGAARDALSYLDNVAEGDEDGGDDDVVSATMMSDDLLGSYDYLAPEQGADAHNADARSDIYALGCVFFHCLTGEVVFPDANNVRKMLRHAQEEPALVSDLKSEVPRPVADVVATMLKKEPSERYQTAKDVAWALEQVMEFEEHQSLVNAEVDAAFLEWANSTNELTTEGSADSPTAAVADSGLLEFLDWMYEHEDDEEESTG